MHVSAPVFDITISTVWDQQRDSGLQTASALRYQTDVDAAAEPPVVQTRSLISDKVCDRGSKLGEQFVAR